MKIVKMGNIDCEAVSEELVAENVMPEYAWIIKDYLNSKFSGENSPSYFTIERDDYVLYVPDY